jgi:hypothetical protein
MPPRPPDPERRRLGAFYTPAALVDLLIEHIVVPSFGGRTTPPVVMDPSCGDGRLLIAAGKAIRARFGVDPRPYLRGLELDERAAVVAAEALGIGIEPGDARARLAAMAAAGETVDVVIGNPPYLSQLSRETSRGSSSALGGGPYADVAAEFLAASLRVVPAVGGRIGLVLPVSILATRDVAPIRAEVERVAAIDWFWWADRPVFDAQVRTCIVGLETGAVTAEVRRHHGPAAEPIASISQPEGPTTTWSWLITDVAGVPALAIDEHGPVLGDIATPTADFRDQYYGLVGAVEDVGEGSPLVTSGLIDAGRCRWGTRDTRFAGSRYSAPRVMVERLTPTLQAWARARLVPKVLVASQTRAIEAVADASGEWLPSVPVVSVVPKPGEDVWHIAAALTSPVASVWLHHRRLGSGLSANTVRVTASDLAAIPLPRDTEAWHDASTHLRDGDIAACGQAMLVAYGLADRRDLYEWWWERVSGSRERRD